MPSQKEKKKMDFSLTDRFFGSQANFLAVFRFLIKETGGIKYELCKKGIKNTGKNLSDFLLLYFLPFILYFLEFVSVF